MSVNKLIIFSAISSSNNASYTFSFWDSNYMNLLPSHPFIFSMLFLYFPNIYHSYLMVNIFSSDLYFNSLTLLQLCHICYYYIVLIYLFVLFFKSSILKNNFLFSAYINIVILKSMTNNSNLGILHCSVSSLYHF